MLLRVGTLYSVYCHIEELCLTTGICKYDPKEKRIAIFIIYLTYNLHVYSSGVSMAKTKK